MTRSVASVFVLLLFFSSPIFAQVNSTNRANCDLSVRVVTSDQRRIETPVQVTLLSPQGVVGTVQIVGEESAQFMLENGKTYRVTVSGLGIETVTSSYFEINSLETTHTEIIQVKPTQKPDEGSTPSASTVSVSDLKVPKNAASEMKKGSEAYTKGETEKAAAHLGKAIQQYPQYARAYDMLGVIAVKGSDRSKARELFSKSIAVDNTFVPAYVDLARMDLQDQDYAAAESLLTKAIAVNPSFPDALALLASTEFANKEYDKALTDVQRTHALQNHQQFAEVHLMAAKVLRMQGHPDAAITQFQLFLAEKPNSPEADSARKALVSLQATK